MKHNTYKPANPEEVKAIALPVRRHTAKAAILIKHGTVKHRHIRKALCLSGRQMRKAINETKHGLVYSDTHNG